MLHEHMARVGQNRSRSLKWAEKQENFQPKEMCFFLTSTFIELIRQVDYADVSSVAAFVLTDS